MREALKNNSHFTICTKCKFEYLPMTKKALTNCPKCESIEDEAYLNSLEVSYEEVSHENIYDNCPKFSQEEFRKMNRP